MNKQGMNRSTGNVDPAVHLGLVYRAAARFVTRVPQTVEFNELVSAGTIGLMEAARKFDATKGGKFAAYAGPRIRGAICDELRSRDHLSRQARTRLKANGGCGPIVIHLDTAVLSSFEPDDMMRKEIHALLCSIMRPLKPQWLHILVSKYWGGQTQAAIAADMGVSDGRVSQIHQHAIAKMRVEIARKWPFLVSESNVGNWLQ